MRYVLLLLMIHLLGSTAQAQWAAPERTFDRAALTERAGLDEDYRLAEMLIARTQQRRIEALRLQAAANEIEVNNARLREFLCRRFCDPARAMPISIGGQMPIDETLMPAPLPYVPPVDEVDMRWRRPPRRVEVEGNINVQVLPRVPVYRRY